jgi:pimeloyl-ACP methyl ester carboxylesterase
MPTLQLPQGSLFYTDTTTADSPAPPLVLVHGAGGSHLDWPPELRRLPHMRVIAPDLPGHGRADGPGRDDTLAYARDLLALLDALAIPRAIITGHSMGGAIAQQMGIHMPDRVAGLVLIGTGSKLPVDPTLPQRIVDAPEQTVDWIMDWAWSADAPTDLKALGRERLLAVDPGVLRSDYRACQAFDVRDQLAAISAPVLVLAAEADRMVKLKFSLYLAERIPNSDMMIFEGCGHMFPLEKPQEVAEGMLHWLSDQEWDT